MRTFAIALASAGAFALLACGGSSGDTSSSSDGGPTTSNEGGTILPDGNVIPPNHDGGVPVNPDGGPAPPPSDASADGSAHPANWDKFLGDGAYEDVGGVASDSSGNVYYAGYFQGTINFGVTTITATGMSSDMYLAKFDPHGTCLWAERFGDNEIQVADGIAIDPQGDVVVIGFNEGVLDLGAGITLTTAGLEDIFVAKFDPTGKAIWAKGYGDIQTQIGNSVAVDAQGNIAVTGVIEGTTDFGKGPLTSAGLDDIFVAELTSAGATLWANVYGDASNQEGTFVAFDPTGNVAMSADFLGAVNVGGTLTSLGGQDALLAKFGPTGNVLWAKQLGATMDQMADCVAVDGMGNIVLSGGFEGTVDFGKGPLTAADMGAKYLAKYDPNGSALWVKSFGDGNVFDWTAVALDKNGGPVVTGEYVTAIDFGQGPMPAKDGYDIFVARYDGSGNILWGSRYGATSDQYARSVAVDPTGDVVVAGYFLGKMGFNAGDGQMSIGNGLLYIAELAP